jgi:lipoyl(octanoyl) transferase
MSQAAQHPESARPALAAYLLGTVDFEACLALQQRLVYETTGRCDGSVSLLICEHPSGITIGRQGSRADLRLDESQLASRELSVRWVNRGGGAIVHSPGQLAVYPIVPLEWHGWTVGEYMNRLQAGISAALTESGFAGQSRSGHFGIWGRSGQIVALGAAVKSWVSYFGAYVNVSPAMQLVRQAHSDLVERAPMSSLAVERQQPVRITGIRERLIRHLSASLDCPRYHLFTGHPLFARKPRSIVEATARAG